MKKIKVTNVIHVNADLNSGNIDNLVLLVTELRKKHKAKHIHLNLNAYIDEESAGILKGVIMHIR